MKKNEMPEENGTLFVTPLEEVLPSSMLPYAEYVIMDRALPRVEDGLKPVQRRILYTMSEMGLTPDKPHKKSARIVGDCMGKYHPHGDSSVYDAMVRMAQDFNMGMTLVNGHGNFGSVDGDPAAAMRYTEARMEPLALELLRDIDKNTVPFSLNFDDSLKEPDMLPGRFPNLLVNGASGIAVGLATNIPPHNLGEVIDGVCAYIDDPRITLKEMMKHIPAPDFPTGGKLLLGELEQAYRTGKGKISLRAKVSVELAEGERLTGGEENAKRCLVITELPYQVNKANLLKKIAELRDQKSELAPITRVVDESDRTGMRAVVELKGTGQDAENVLRALYKYTDLEVSFGINMVAIAGGKPMLLGLLDIIKYYVEYQREVVLRRTKFDLAQAKERCHILEGLIIAVRNIDEVIAIIKAAESTPDAREKLKIRFSLSDKQAQAILDLRLARLTKLEVYKLEQELKELKELIEKLSAIVASTKLQLNVVKEEISEIGKKYAVGRKTALPVSEEEAFAERNDVYVPAEPAIVVLTANGKMKCVPESDYRKADRSFSPNLKKEQIVLLSAPILSDAEALVFTDRGNCCRVSMKDCAKKWKETGVRLSDIADVQKDEMPVALFSADDASGAGAGRQLIFITSGGMIKRTELGEYNVNKDIFSAITLSEGDSLLTVREDDPSEEAFLFFVTREGMCLRAKMNDIPLQKRVSQGVRGMNLKETDRVVWTKRVEDYGEIIVVTSDNLFKRVIVGNVSAMNRACKGMRIADLKNSSILFCDYVTDPYTLAVYTDQGLKELYTEDIPLGVTYTRGKCPEKLKGCTLKEIYSLKTD